MTRRDVVLVVDDTPGTLGMLNDALESAGFMVLLAQSAAAAFSVIERVAPDIILMDAIMPGMDGFEACRRLRRLPELTNVPIVFMTGLTESASVVRGLEAGGVDYVTKPLRPDEVIARLGVHLANARLARSSQAALDVAGRYLLAVDPEGRILWATPQARSLLAAAGLDACVPSLAGQLDRNPGGSLVGPSLELQHVGQVSDEERLFRVMPAADPEREATLLKERLQLTSREAEVLVWLGRGKSNRDIADILLLSPRTVNKHLEQIYPKLGVENRAAATALTVKIISST
ncbi:two component transcriptional regulator, LuxR family [Arboricoccus pini]|uniref:Two component transcriptional regulator, LuxR family n=1 Tax=Arboricoccus pini TaxID=1963835 RepID=A0A212RCV2_9PROT|nr:DNA-binding response regulator [Arboricoccus pini]SNB69944.1 two component transcriptional regulator, LuxR family [Arboricoccus pini]